MEEDEMNVYGCTMSKQSDDTGPETEETQEEGDKKVEEEEVRVYRCTTREQSGDSGPHR